MRLCDVHEVLPVGGHAHVVVERRIRETAVVLPVEADAVELQLHRVVAVARRVPHHAGLLVHLLDRLHLERVVGERAQELPGVVVQVEVGEAGALGDPQEALPIGEPTDRWVVLHPRVRPFLANHHPAAPRRRGARRELEHVLAPVRAVERDLRAVRRPRDLVDVVAHHVVGEGRAVAHVHAGGPAGREIVDEEVDHGVGRTRLGIGLAVERVLDLGLLELEVVVRDVALVEAVVGQLRSVRRPPHGRDLPELLSVDPARRPVLDAILRASVRGDGTRTAPVRGAHPQVPVAIERLHGAVRRHRRRELTAPLRAPAAEAARLRRLAHVRRSTGGDVVAVEAVLARVLERLPVVGPCDAQRARDHGAGNPTGHLLVAGVAGHLLDALLRGRAGGGHRRRQDGGEGGERVAGATGQGGHGGESVGRGGERPSWRGGKLGRGSRSRKRGLAHDMACRVSPARSWVSARGRPSPRSFRE